MPIDVDRVVAIVKANNEAHQRLIAEMRRLTAENAELKKAAADRSATDAVEQILEHLANVTAQIGNEIASLTPSAESGS